MSSPALSSATASDQTLSEQPLSTCYQQALQQAADKVAPIWPLDQWIAVNPWWGMKHLPIEQAEHQLAQRAGIKLTMPMAFYREAWEQGRIQRGDLGHAIEASGKHYSEQALLAFLQQEETAKPHHLSVWELPTNADTMPNAGQWVFDQVAEICQRYFDRHQQRWETAHSGSLFREWKMLTRFDRRWPVALREPLENLPEEIEPATGVLVEALGLAPEELEALVHTLLLRVNGWASWCQGLAWHTPKAQAAGGVQALTAILLAWEWLGVSLLSPAQKDLWRQQWQASSLPLSTARWCWHRAYEVGYQRRLASLLRTPPERQRDGLPSVQAAFCIDVRSERLRRHIEAVSPEVETLGVAGFFGLALTYGKAGPERALPRSPGLLTPRYHAEEAAPHETLNRLRYQQEATRQSVRHAKYSALSTFTLVETTGLAWGWKLLKDSLKKSVSGNPVPKGQGIFHRYDGEPLSGTEKLALARGLMVNLGIKDRIAPLLVLVGHDSQSDNNPHHAGLACGACGGQGGGLNARLAAELLNDPEVRRSLAVEGMPLPKDTHVIAAQHCTLTDRVTLIDAEALPEALNATLEAFQHTLEEAAQGNREERAMELGVDADSHAQRLTKLAQRGADWSQPRPEWGLANNAALVLAPRHFTRNKPLGGRVFLHEYHAAQDADGKTLEALMTAPMLVSNWINLQYYASCVSPRLYGAGNKLLHSVVGGHLGVIEGNCPQLRIGLPEQSLHDGEQWYHEPLRLTVVVDAPRHVIEGVLSRQEGVAALVNNRWLWLSRPVESGLEIYTQEGWKLLPG